MTAATARPVVPAAADDEPEHRGDRRRFLVWALMLGYTKPAVVVERIVGELEDVE